MPSIRIGLTTDFNLVGEQVGIGTTNPTATLEVVGQIRANNISASSGVTTFTEYTGFLQPVQLISNTVSIAETTKGNLNSLSDEIKISGEVTIEPDVSVTGGRLDSLTTTDRFAVPLGETNNRDNAPEAGTIRFNQDFGTLEFFDGVNWKTVNSYARGGAAGRAVFGGGNYAPGESSSYDYVIMSTLGNTVNFGEITLARANPGACGDGVRAVFAGGEAPSSNDTIDYNSIPSGGVGADFGNLTSSFRYMAGCSSSTRGIFFSGSTPSAADAIEYIEIQTTGNSLDFGNLIGNGILNHGACSSPVRAISMDGQVGGDQQIQYVTIASKGNALSFGQGLYTSGSGNGDAIRSCSNDITGLGAGAGATNIIAYITMATTGNAQDFGDLTRGRYGIGATASKIRGIFNSGWSPSIDNNIDYVTFASKGNAIDFGDASDPRREQGATSDSHGGLGGF